MREAKTEGRQEGRESGTEARRQASRDTGEKERKTVKERWRIKEVNRKLKRDRKGHFSWQCIEWEEEKGNKKHTTNYK